MTEQAVSAADRLRHVAIVMDGNGRWAKKNGYSIARGHKVGARNARSLMRTCADHGIEILTLFAFSSENWKRSKAEVGDLLGLFSTYLRREVAELHREQVRLIFIGDRSRLRPGQVRKMVEAEKLTRNNSRSTLVVAIDYGGRWDIVNAAKQLMQDHADGLIVADQVDETLFEKRLSTGTLPPPDLLIRTGGELRISNFLLWQCAYTELYFSSLLWPEFDTAAFLAAIEDFSRRQRRFGDRVPSAAGS